MLPSVVASELEQVAADAIRTAFHLLPGSPRNTLVATGTGSGKTECFLLPLLEHCRQQQAQGQRGIKAILDLQEVEPRKRDCVLNRCLIDRETNQRISYCAPSDHMAEQRKEPDFPMKILLVSHLMTHGYETGLWADDFERFLQQQLELVGAPIAQATGATHEKPAFVH